MATLNDTILFEIPNANGYQNYTLKLGTPIRYDTPHINTVHVGRVYKYKNPQYLAVNDLLSTYADNYSWMSPDNVRQLNMGNYWNSIMHIKFEPADNIQARVYMAFDSTTTYQDVTLYHPAPNSEDKSITTNWHTSIGADSMNMLSLSTKVLPRIPKLNVPTTEFFVGGLFGVNEGWSSNSQLDGDPVFAVTLFDKNFQPVEDERDGVTVYDLGNRPFNSILIGGYIVAGHSPGGFDLSDDVYKYIGIAQVGTDSNDDTYIKPNKPVILAEYDDCLHDYYLIWVDRTGGYQCQPFNRKTTMKEDITTTSVTNILDESRPIIKSVSVSYDLKSDWLSFDEYNAYESIFVSPYIYLYDTKLNHLTPVTCSQKQWVEKNTKNTKKPFNLQITVTANKNQNIVY